MKLIITTLLLGASTLLAVNPPKDAPPEPQSYTLSDSEKLSITTAELKLTQLGMQAQQLLQDWKQFQEFKDLQEKSTAARSEAQTAIAAIEKKGNCHLDPQTLICVGNAAPAKK